MMPTSPRSPLSFRTAGFPQYGWKVGFSDGAFPVSRPAQACSRYALTDVRFTSALRAPRGHISGTALSRGPWARLCTAIRWHLHHPRGPRSGPGCRVPVRHHLIGPIRPARRHTAISPHGAAYRRCLRCAGAPRRPASGSALSLSIPSWHAVLSDPGEFDRRSVPEQRRRRGLRRVLNGSALPKLPQSVSRGA